jgi:hypothetical protein
MSSGAGSWMPGWRFGGRWGPDPEGAGRIGPVRAGGRRARPDGAPGPGTAAIRSARPCGPRSGDRDGGHEDGNEPGLGSGPRATRPRSKDPSLGDTSCREQGRPGVNAVRPSPGRGGQPVEAPGPTRHSPARCRVFPRRMLPVGGNPGMMAEVSGNVRKIGRDSRRPFRGPLLVSCFERWQTTKSRPYSVAGSSRPSRPSVNSRRTLLRRAGSLLVSRRGSVIVPVIRSMTPNAPPTPYAKS